MHEPDIIMFMHNYVRMIGMMHMCESGNTSAGPREGAEDDVTPE